jgi:hypothetical protein
MSKKDGNTYGQNSSQFKRCIVESPIPSEISDDFAQCQKKYRKLSTNNAIPPAHLGGLYIYIIYRPPRWLGGDPINASEFGQGVLHFSSI